MKNLFFVHCGLPKTATTTFQKHILNTPRTESNSFTILSKDQNRKVFSKITNFLSYGGLLQPLRLSNTLFWAIYSNENLMLDHGPNTWQSKVKRLSILSEKLSEENFKLRLVVFTRKPSSLFFSLYTELSKNLAKGVSQFDFYSSNQSSVLDPASIYSQMLQVKGIDQIAFVDFEALVRTNFKILSKEIPFLDISDSLPNANSRQKLSNSIQARHTNMYDILYDKLGDSELLKRLFRLIPANDKLISFFTDISLPNTQEVVFTCQTIEGLLQEADHAYHAFYNYRSQQVEKGELAAKFYY